MVGWACKINCLTDQSAAADVYNTRLIQGLNKQIPPPPPRFLIVHVFGIPHYFVHIDYSGWVVGWLVGFF